MGEIKSTLDLVMERTRHLVPTDREREEMARREQDGAVQALVRRLLDAQVSPEALRREIHDREGSTPSYPWRETACRELVRAASPGENADDVLSALAALHCPWAGELEGLVKRLLGEEEASRAEASERLRAALGAEGISGTSVLPNPETDPLWREERGVLRDRFARERDRLAGGSA